MSERLEVVGVHLELVCDLLAASACEAACEAVDVDVDDDACRHRYRDEEQAGYDWVDCSALCFHH